MEFQEKYENLWKDLNDLSKKYENKMELPEYLGLLMEMTTYLIYINAPTLEKGKGLSDSAIARGIRYAAGKRIEEQKNKQQK